MLVLDIGGTDIKYALTDAQGQIKERTVGRTPAHADGDYETCMAVLSGLIAWAQREQGATRACVSIPGPFDFESGVSRMRHKFPALYGRTLCAPFEQAGMTVEFLHDSTAFLLGEAHDGVLHGQKSPCCVMLGTGLGFAFMREGRVCVSMERGPACSLWNMPYGAGIAEDFVSTRAIQGVYGEGCSVADIAMRAREGDERARAAFLQTGEHLSRILSDVILRLGCDSFALGGQIAKSADLLALRLPVPCMVSAHIDDAALRGASYYAHSGREACERVSVP